MRKRMYWGLAALIILLLGATVFLFVKDQAEIRQLEKELADAKEQETQQQAAENDLPPAKPGFKWVEHGDHHHEVPIDAPDTWQGEPHKPIAQGVPASVAYKEYTGPLTFHKELLETNPLEALRLQSEERDHWSAKWITGFSADDLEAQAFARTVYLNMYYDTLYRHAGKIPISDAEYTQLGADLDSHYEAIRTLPNVYRQLALIRISWVYLPPDREPVLSEPLPFWNKK